MDNIGDFLRWFVDRFDRVKIPEQFQAVSNRLDALTAQQQQTNQQLGAIMANLQQFTAALDRIDTATSNAATVLKEVREKVAKLEAEQGISAADEESVLKRLDGVASALDQMGKSPENPVPVDPNPTEPTEPTEPANPNPGTPTEPTV